MKKLAVATILIATLFAAPSLAKEMGHAGMHKGDYQAQMWKGLNLTPAQQQKVKDLQKQDRPQMKDAVKAMRTEMKALMALYSDPNADDAKLKAQHDKVQAAMAQVMNLHFDHMLAVRAILTPEQRKKFSSGRMKGHAMGTMDCPMCESMEENED